MNDHERRFRAMTDSEIIESYRRHSLAHDEHPECLSGSFDREVIRRIETLAKVRRSLNQLDDGKCNPSEFASYVRGLLK